MKRTLSALAVRLHITLPTHRSEGLPYQHRRLGTLRALSLVLLALLASFGSVALAVSAATPAGATGSVASAPLVTSADTVDINPVTGGTFTVTTSGSPTPSLSTSALPDGVSFTDNLDGTGTITVAPGTAGGVTDYLFVVATNGNAPDDDQWFGLQLMAPATFTSPTTVNVGQGDTFTVTATGSPTPNLWATDALPDGFTLVDNGDGTATVSVDPSTPPGDYNVDVTADNGQGLPATETVVATVFAVAAFDTGPVYDLGANGTGNQWGIPVGTYGWTNPTITIVGDLPPGLVFSDNGDGTGTLWPTVNEPAGTYAFTIEVSTPGLAPVFQNATFYYNTTPAITSATETSFPTGTASTFTVTSTGVPAPAIYTYADNDTNGMPPGMSFTDNGDGTGTLSEDGSTSPGTYFFYVYGSTWNETMGQGANDDAVPSSSALSYMFVTVTTAPTFTSPDTAAISATGGTAAVTTSGSPTAALSATGLPVGVSFTDNGDGTGTLTSAPGTTDGSYPITLSANDGFDIPTTQALTLSVTAPPAITSSTNTTFLDGSPGTFAVTSSGFPTAALSAAGLPAGLTFTDNGDGTGTLSGTPASGSSGSYPVTLTATNGIAPDATQNLVLTVYGRPVITSPDTASIPDTGGSFTVTTSGLPFPTMLASGMPDGVTFTDNGDGTGTLTAAPGVPDGAYPIALDVYNGYVADSLQTLTLSITAPPAITSDPSTTFSEGTDGFFTVTTSGYPTSSLTESGPLPSGVTFTDDGDGTATFVGTPDTGSSGSYPITINASNGASPDAPQAFVLTVVPAAAITSTYDVNWPAAAGGSFTITTAGIPNSPIAAASVPAGVTFTDNGDGTATLSAAPGASAAGSYFVGLSIGSGPSEYFSFLFLTITIPPTITSTGGTTWSTTDPANQLYTVTTTGTPNASLWSPDLPVGVSLTNNNDGTAILSGDGTTPAGNYTFTIYANNGYLPVVTQDFTLTVDDPPAFTSASSATISGDTGGTFTVTTSGTPTPTSWTSPMPAGLTYSDNGDGTGTLTVAPGTPATSSGSLWLEAVNGISPDAEQYFTLTVTNAPAITSTGASTWSTSDLADQLYTVTSSGSPTTALSATGLPSGVTFVDNGDGTGILAGNGVAAGSYLITLTATNGAGPDATQDFVLTVGAPPAFTSAGSATLDGTNGDTFTATTSGYPTPLLSTSPLPEGVSFTDNGDGTGTITVAPDSPPSSGGFWLSTGNGIGSNVGQWFTLTVTNGPAFTSGDSTTWSSTDPTGDSYTVASSGSPTATLTASSLPNGVSFTDNGGGTGFLLGDGATAPGVYPITLSAANGAGPDATQSFTLTITAPSAVTSAVTSAPSVTLDQGVAGSFTVTTTGTPTPSIAESGALPAGMTFVDNGVGTATLAGTPTSSGVFPVTFTATNGIGADATQSFTLTVLTAPAPPVTTPAATVGGSVVAATPDGTGYWVVSASGAVTPHGSAVSYGSPKVLAGPIVGMASTPSGHGYWLVGADGGIFAYGDAGFYGSMGGHHLNLPIVGMARSVSGHGYWLVAGDGGIFAFGDAAFAGSTGSTQLNQPIVGMTAAPAGGYWMVASDGGVFAYGSAAFYGSTGGIHLNQPIVGIAATPAGNGYWMVAADGGVFCFGGAAFHGSLSGQYRGGPSIGIISSTVGAAQGYSLVTADGQAHAFGG